MGFRGRVLRDEVGFNLPGALWSNGVKCLILNMTPARAAVSIARIPDRVDTVNNERL